MKRGEAQTCAVCFAIVNEVAMNHGMLHLNVRVETARAQGFSSPGSNSGRP